MVTTNTQYPPLGPAGTELRWYVDYDSGTARPVLQYRTQQQTNQYHEDGTITRTWSWRQWLDVPTTVNHAELRPREPEL